MSPAESDRPLRVGYVLKKFPRLSETFILNEVLELQRQGVDVHVISLYPPDDGRFHAGVAELKNPVVYVPEMRLHQAFAELLRERPLVQPMLARLGDALQYLLDLGEEQGAPVLKRALAVAIAMARLDLHHVHAHFATIAVRTALVCRMLTGASYSFTCHAKDIYRDTVSPTEFARLLDHAAFAVTVCDANREFVLDRLAPGRGDKLMRLYNGVDLTRFVAAPSVASEEPPEILAVGRLVPKKGFHVLLDACAQLKRRGIVFRCVLVGDGEEKDALVAQVAELGLADVVTLTGALSHEAIVPLLQRATLACLPCIEDDQGNRDALPTTLLEALACGLPCVSTPVGGVPEIVHEGVHGHLVPQNDSASLADALARLLADPTTRARFGAAGRAHALDRFDLTRNVAMLRGRFAQALAVRSAHAVLEAVS